MGLRVEALYNPQPFSERRIPRNLQFEIYQAEPIMLGQGSPNIACALRDNELSYLRERLSARWGRQRYVGATLLFVFFVSATTVFADPTVQLRMEWSRGSDHPRQWQGTVTVDRGTVNVGRILGNEADEPGSIWAEGNRIEIRQRSKHAFDGFDFSVTAAPSATITVEFRDLQDPATSATSQTTIADLISKPSIVTELDKLGNRLVIRRTPGDMLHVKLPQDRLVFSPGEALRMDVEPRSLPVVAGTALQLRARMTTVNGAAEVGVQEQSFKTGAEESIPASLTFDFKTPPNEARMISY